MVESRFERTEEGWERLNSARFVGPADYQEQLAHGPASDLVADGMTNEVLTQALAAAADEDGTLLDFSMRTFYEQHVSDALRNADDPSGWKVTYDRFVAMALMEAIHRFVEIGLLGHRGNGDTVDWRLAVPPVTQLASETSAAQMSAEQG